MGSVLTPTVETWPTTADAVVIGGGMVGVATAFWLSRAGLDTVLLEMRSDLGSLTSAQSIESFRAQFTEPAMAELAQESICILENFAEIIGIPNYDLTLRYTGYLFVTDDPGRVGGLQAAVAKHHALGVTDSEFLTAAEIRARFPYISEQAVAATFRQRDGQFSSHAAIHGFVKGSAARFLLNTRAIGIRQDAHGVCAFETQHGVIATRLVLNAAGPFAGVVGRMLGLDLPLQPMRRQKVYITPKPQIPQDAPLVIDVARLNCGYWAGVMLGAAAGRRVADLATGKLAPQQNPLRPTRYAEGITYTGDSFLRGHH